MNAAIPKTMRAILLDDYHEDAAEAIRNLKIAERPVPKPRRGEVLVRIEAAPCNPSDLLLLQGKYGVRKSLPTVPGWEGAGTVAASGGGWFAGWLNKKRVACGIRGDHDGTWAEYVAASATSCIPLKPQLDLEQAASLIVNPLTALGLLDTARRQGHRAAVHTGAASQLGRMLLRLAVDANYPLICIVRRQEQIQLLESLGANTVLNSSDADFFERLEVACRQLRATVAFEAVAGPMTGIVLNAMPANSCVYVYGALSEEPCSAIDPVGLIFSNKSVTGFYLGEWLESRGAVGMLRAAGNAQRLLIDGRFQTTIKRRLGLHDVPEGLQQYLQNMTDGKMLIKPHSA